VEGAIHTLLYSRSRHFLVIVTQSMQLYQYVVDPSGNTTTLAMDVSLFVCDHVPVYLVMCHGVHVPMYLLLHLLLISY